MSIDGVWKAEWKGPYGWEKVGTVFLQNGSYLGASTDHFSTGSYTVDGDVVTADIQVTQYGKVRSVYGVKKRQLNQRVEAKIKEEGKIVGKSNASEGKKYDVKVRLTRLGDLD